MKTIIASKARRITTTDIDHIRRLISENPSWNRTRLSQELCRSWEWYSANGQARDMACRTMLLKLERQGHIVLPLRLCSANNHRRNQNVPDILHTTDDIYADLKDVTPLCFVNISQDKDDQQLFRRLLHRYHYLGYNGSPGENIGYLVYDRMARPLTCLLFAAAAWKTAPRDKLIGWDSSTRQRHLSYLTNNSRLLILPWVHIRNLATYILARVVKRINNDWIGRYHHPIYLLETFVDQSRFRGTCYQAANWIKIGQTTGRTRYDRSHRIKRPLKDIYVYPLIRTFREVLSQ